MVERIVDDVVDRRLVLVLGLDHPRPVPPPEDVILSLVALVEGAGVGAVQVPHPVGQVRERRFDEEVVVVAHQAAHVRAPAVTPFDPPQDVEEDDPVSIVENDCRIVVSPDPDVVVGTRSEVTVRPSHLPKVALRKPAGGAVTLSLHVQLGPVTCQARDWGGRSIASKDVSRRGWSEELGRDFGALEMLVRRAVVALRKGRALARLALARRRTAACDAAVQCA